MQEVRKLIDKLGVLVSRARKARSIKEALSQIVPPRLVREALQDHREEELFAVLSVKCEIDEAELLQQTAQRLGFALTQTLQAPTAKLLELSGIEASTFRQALAVPQEALSAAGYCIAIANPLQVEVAEFERRGIRVYLSTKAAIAEAWKAYDEAEGQSVQKRQAEELSEAQLRIVLSKLATDAHYCGGQAVFLGEPDEGSYQFLAPEATYAGRIHYSVYRTLLAMLSRGGVLSLPVESELISEIRLSLTRSFAQVVICLVWELKNRETPVEDLVGPYANTGQISAGKEESVVATNDETAANDTPVDEAQVVAESPAPQEIKTGKKASLLLVDDDERFLTLLSWILESKGFTVHKESDARQALNLLQSAELHIDLLISDVHMPNMDGEIFLQELRRRGLGLPVLMLTSDEETLLEAELALLGADAFVRKQEDPRLLIAWVNNLVKRRQQQPGQLRLQAQRAACASLQ